MTFSNRLNIKPKDVNSFKSENSEDRTLKVMLSLFDVPESATAGFDEKDQLIILNFEYMGGEEETIHYNGGGAVSLILGKHSERLYGVRISVQKLEQQQDFSKDSELIINVTEEMENYKKVHPRRRSKSFEAVDRVLSTYSSQIEPLLEQAFEASQLSEQRLAPS